MKNNRWLRPGENDLKSQRPDLAAEWDYDKNGELLPEHVTTGSSIEVQWKCSKYGLSYPAPVANRTRGNGCPYYSGKKWYREKQIC